MTNQEILNIATALENVGQLVGEKFTYFVARNNNLLKPVLKSFVENRQALQESFAKKDEAGDPILLDDKDDYGRPTKRYDITDKKTFDAKLKELMKEETEIKLYRISKKNVPTNINATQLTGIIELVDETNEPSGK